MKKIEENNTLVFLVDTKANKRQIKAAVHSLYDIKAAKVRCPACFSCGCVLHQMNLLALLPDQHAHKT
jgi:hypothetical protein